MRLNAYIRDNYADDAFEPVYSFEEDAELSALNMEQVRALEVLAPFGEGNPEPVFRIRQATLNDVRRMRPAGEPSFCFGCAEWLPDACRWLRIWRKS